VNIVLIVLSNHSRYPSAVHAKLLLCCQSNFNQQTWRM